MAEEGAPAVATAYLELLYQVLEEGVLTQAEAQSLVEVAEAYLLTADQVPGPERRRRRDGWVTTGRPNTA